MNKKIGVLSLLAIALILMPIVFAVEIKVIAKPERDVVVSVLDDNGDSIDSFTNKTGDDGIVLFNYDTLESKIDLNVIVRYNGKFEYGGPKKFEDQKTIRTIVIDLENLEEVEEVNNETTNQTIESNETVEVNETVETADIIEEPVEETTEEVAEETGAGVTGAAVTGNIKTFLSKTIVYIIIIVIIAAGLLVFIFRKKIGKKASSGFKIKKMSDMKKDKRGPKDSADDNRKLEDAEKKLKEAKGELDELKERKRKLEEVRERYEKDREELKEMGED